MAQLPIVTLKSPTAAILHQPAAKVREFGPALHKLLDSMAETMREAPGVGLAAPQVGVSQRIAVVEYPVDEENPDGDKHYFELINPEIIKSKGSEVGQEGCLSMPGLAADVPRATYVLIKTFDRNGKEIRIKAYDWLARIFQHEIDHLHGILMTDKADQVYRVVENEKGEVELVPLEKELASV